MEQLYFMFLLKHRIDFLEMLFTVHKILLDFFFRTVLIASFFLQLVVSFLTALWHS